MIKGQATAERIQDAALTLFSRDGFDGVSVQDIADAAGVNKASVFYHHDSKEGLLQALLDRYYVRYAEALQSALSRSEGGVTGLHALLDANLDFIEENLDSVRLVQLEIALGAERLDRIRGGMSLLFQAVENLLDTVGSGDPRTSPQQLFVSFSGMVNGYFLQAEALEAIWGANPLGVAQLRERRQHLHWMLDALAAAL